MTTSPIALDLGNLDQDRIALHQRFGDRVDPQPAYVEIDENGSVSADCDGELGGEIPAQVRNRLTLRVPVAAEVECGDLETYLRGAALPLLQAIDNSHSVQWDGSDDLGTLTCEAEWREHPDRLARAHVDALRTVSHISARQAANWSAPRSATQRPSARYGSARRSRRRSWRRSRNGRHLGQQALRPQFGPECLGNRMRHHLLRVLPMRRFGDAQHH